MLINGSPHKSGCTYTALAEVAEALQEEKIEVEWLHVGLTGADRGMPGCIACGQCRKTGYCYIHDEVNMLLDGIAETDGMIIGSPTYYGSPSGPLLSFLDRLFFAAAGRFAGKLGGAVVSGRRAGATGVLECLYRYYATGGMMVVHSQYWCQVYGHTPQEVQKDQEGMQTMRLLGRNMAWLLKSIEAGKKAGVLPPKEERRRQTDFIPPISPFS